MKKFNYLMLVLFAMMLSMSFTACSDDDDDDNTPKEEIHNVHYDIWVTLGETSGMGSSSSIIVKNVNSLEDPNQSIAFLNEGTDVTAKLYQESIIKGKYYYQIPKEPARFGKYQITNNGIITIAEHKFEKNTYQDRRYTHAWTSDNEFVVLAANGDKNDVVWTKFNANDMSIVAEGNLNLPNFSPEVITYSTSGLANYRKADNTLIYLYCEKSKKGTKAVYAAFVDAATMTVKNVDKTTVGEEMGGTAYGELLQSKMFFNDNGNLYIPLMSQVPGSTTTTCGYTRIVRIMAGQNKFDTSWVGMNNGDRNGKVLTCENLGNGKALFYITNPEYTGTSDDNSKKDGWGITNYNSYYAIYDVNTDALTEITYNGQRLPFSAGTFSQRSFVLGNKAFIGTNPKDALPTIYIYNIKTGEVTKGSTIAEGYELSRIVYIDNE